MIPDSLFEPTLNNGYGYFSLWDSFRAWTKMDMSGYIWDHKLNQWLYKQVCE